VKVLLVNPPAINVYHRVGLRLPPLGLAYVGAVLKKNGHKVKLIDLNVERINFNNFPFDKFGLVGLSVDTTRYPASVKIAQAAKKRGVKVVAGGFHPTFMDKEALETGGFDYVVRGEGEYIMLDLVNHLERGLPLDEVDGISYIKDKELVVNPDAPLASDLDSIPFPSREIMPLDAYTTAVKKEVAGTMITSRGCPFDCEFCSCSRFCGIKWRTRSVENIMDEIDLLYNKYGYRSISFLDDNFTLSPKRVVEICEQILRRNMKFSWFAMTRVDSVVRNEKVVELMERAGLRQVFVGFESGNQEILDKYGKKAEVDIAFKATEILKKYRIEVWGSFIIGALNETREMIRQTIRFAKKLNPNICQFSILIPYPGSRLFDKVRDRILTKDWEAFWGGFPVMKLNKITPQEMKSWIIKAYASFYLRPRTFFSTGLPFLYELFLGFKHNRKPPFVKVNGDWVPTKALG